MSIEVAIPGDRNVIKTEAERTLKYRVTQKKGTFEKPNKN